MHCHSHRHINHLPTLALCQCWSFLTHHFPHARSYFGFGTAAIMCYLVANGPDTSLQAWARPYAAKELKEEDEIFARYESDPEYQKEVSEKLRAHGKAPDRYYDGVMMRHEFAVLKAKHAAGSA